MACSAQLCLARSGEYLSYLRSVSTIPTVFPRGGLYLGIGARSVPRWQGEGQNRNGEQTRWERQLWEWSSLSVLGREISGHTISRPMLHAATRHCGLGHRGDGGLCLWGKLAKDQGITCRHLITGSILRGGCARPRAEEFSALDRAPGRREVVWRTVAIGGRAAFGVAESGHLLACLLV